MKTIEKSISFLINGNKAKYSICELNNIEKSFMVTKRYKAEIVLPKTNEPFHLSCKLNINSSIKKTNPETDENLFAVSFYWKNCKLCIGTLGDLPGISYNYSNNSIDIYGKYPEESVIFCIAYVDEVNEYTELAAWLASDPSYRNTENDSTIYPSKKGV